MLKLALNADAPYILKEDRDSAAPTTFYLKTLTVGERMQLANLGDLAASDNPQAQFKAMLDYCKLGVRRIEGEGIPESASVADILESVVDPGVIIELASAITDHNRLGDAPAKNSDGRSGPPDPAGSAAVALVTPEPRSGARKKQK
ncbi:MAG: hypothetical protein HQL95_02315 [Magnetococcales bacterium]|nr:hypothetical protein [Magnetococcales bacterium]